MHTVRVGSSVGTGGAKMVVHYDVGEADITGRNMAKL